MTERSRSSMRWVVAMARCALGLRWLAFAVLLFLSVHHWMRVGYWEFSGVWQYGLVLLDPRVSAALVWWLIQTAFLLLVLLPAAQWLSERLPTAGPARIAASLALAIGLGTRGVVGPLVVRAAVAAPALLHSGDGEQIRSWLTEPYAARWLVALAESWWLLPFLALALRFTSPRRASSAETWRFRGFLALATLLQSIDAPYLLTAGGPRGATSTLQLIAFQEGWGRQEFGYASVIAVLLGLACLAAACLIPCSAAGPPPSMSPSTNRGVALWALLGLCMLAPLVGACSRGLAWIHALPPAATVAATFWGVTAASVWTSALGTSLAHSLPASAGVRSRLAYAGLLFPGLLLVLPLIRPLGIQSGAVAAGTALLGAVCLTPYLGLAAAAARGIADAGVGARRTLPLTAGIVAWAVWTDLTLPLLLSQGQDALLPLQGWMLWDLAAHLRPSPLSVPGWSVAWVGGSLLAGFAAFRLLGLGNAADSGIGAARSSGLAEPVSSRPI